MRIEEKKQFPVRLFLCLFAFQLLYSFAVVNAFSFPVVSDTPYECHAADFSLGFCSKLLPGAIYNLFVSTPSQTSATVYESILLVLFFAAVSAMLCVVFTRISKENEKTFFVLCAFFLTGPSSIAVFGYSPGMLDFYWAISTVLFFAVIKSKYLKYCIPLIAVFAVTCHTGGCLTYVLLFAIVLLYEASRREKGKERNAYLVIFAFTCVFALAAFTYFTVFDDRNLIFSASELDEFLTARGAKSYYYICSFYREEAIARLGNPDKLLDILSGEVYAEGSLPRKIFNLVKIHLWLYDDFDYKKTFFNAGALTALLLPQAILLYGFFIKKLHNKTEKPLARFSYFCTLALMPFVTVTSFFVSTDSPRWIAHSFIMLYGIFFYIQHSENGSGLKYLRERCKNVHPMLTAAYFLLNFFTVFNPYG